MAEQFVFSGETLMLVQCGVCGVKHAIQAVRYNTCVEEGGYWQCPNGHSRGFRHGREERRKIERERDRLKQENARLAEEAATSERAKAALARHQKRSAAGLCPCCNRTFSNMARHMKTSHPDFNVVPLKAATA
jgi:hypothetical protein